MRNPASSRAVEPGECRLSSVCRSTNNPGRAEWPGARQRARARQRVSQVKETIDMRRMTNMLTGRLARSCCSAAAPRGPTSTIATAGPMTGQYAVFGEQMKRGAEMAVKDINAKGGVNGEQLVLEVGDDACDPKQAVAVANQFVNDGVKFVAGHFCSGSSIPASAVYNEEGILQISPASTNPQADRAGLRQRLPHLRPRRRAGHLRRQLRGRQQDRLEGRDPPRQDGLRQGPGRRVQEGAECARASRRSCTRRSPPATRTSPR